MQTLLALALALGMETGPVSLACEKGEGILARVAANEQITDEQKKEIAEEILRVMPDDCPVMVLM